MTAVVEPKARARYAAKRDAIMGAATKVFNDHGVSGFTLAAVAKRMDLHPVSLTYYFKRKEDLAAAVLHETMARFNAMLEQAEVETTPAARLRAFVAAYYETRRRVALGQEIPLAPFSEISLIEGEQHQPLIEAFTGLYIRIGRLMKSPDLPWITPARRQALARLVVFQLTWSDAWLDSYEPEDYARVAARVADVMIGGLAADGQAWPDLPLLPLGSPVAQNDEVTRDRFLVAATKLINREGYRGASVDKISAELKVTKGSFYHHNADKDELAAACFARTFELVDDAKRRAGAADTGWNRLWLAVVSLAMHQASAEGGRMLRHHALAAVPHPMRRQVLVRFQQIAHSFAGMISDGVADGSVRPVDPLLAAQLMMVVFNASLALDWRNQPGDVTGLMDAYVRPALLGFFVE
ncbi:TetR/AcrR family transcriptional regulator [Phenylobacterium sp.]|uniref:TetR/AcrR family transcriptional regulator n=1 Tax=Phenylobacterium sp. TaxID=1871053 RepID=UPI0027363A5F|nr:TetR/AcrR family transcriptional regulator [Phenylobacterium sp.]MDP3854172.1 TetR/AcrR family transcriptional regulator [Phenylobacterium sp.]